MGRGEDLTTAEFDALMWLPCTPHAVLFGAYPHGDTRPVAADSIERAEALWGLTSGRHLALVDIACVDRPGTGEPWRDRRWVLTPEGVALRTHLEMKHAIRN